MLNTLHASCKTWKNKRGGGGANLHWRITTTTNKKAIIIIIINVYSVLFLIVNVRVPTPF
jgi:hypothetical protein